MCWFWLAGLLSGEKSGEGKERRGWEEREGGRSRKSWMGSTKLLVFRAHTLHKYEYLHTPNSLLLSLSLTAGLYCCLEVDEYGKFERKARTLPTNTDTATLNTSWDQVMWTQWKPCPQTPALVSRRSDICCLQY